MFLIATCIACGNTFGCNPNTVPSLRFKGVKQAICKPCALRWCSIHKVNPDEMIRTDAYEPVNEFD